MLYPPSALPFLFEEGKKTLQEWSWCAKKRQTEYFLVFCEKRIRTLNARDTFYFRLMPHLWAGYAKLHQSLVLFHMEISA